MRVHGHELRSRGIHAGDILIANAAAEPVSGKVCVAFLQGEVMLATLTLKNEAWWLTEGHLGSTRRLEMSPGEGAYAAIGIGAPWG